MLVKAVIFRLWLASEQFTALLFIELLGKKGRARGFRCAIGSIQQKDSCTEGQRLGREALPGGASGLHPLCGQSCLLAPSSSGIAASCTLFVGDRGVLHSLRLAASCTLLGRPRGVLLGPPFTKRETSSLPPIYRP